MSNNAVGHQGVRDSNLHYFIGLMSGTSADGVDAALVDFSAEIPKLHATLFTPYPSLLKQQILDLYLPGANEIERLGVLDVQLGLFYGQCVNQLLANAKVTPNRVCAIGSHGQTIRHRPKPNSPTPFTLQIGCPNTLSEATHITVVADFRRRDIAAGGQGAPLTPGFHREVFAHQTEARAVINIGGIANITLLRPNAPVLGYDTGPGNGLMDYWIAKHLGKHYDENGQWAASGSVNQALLHAWLNHPFFHKPAPKSTGREEFSSAWLEESLTQFSAVQPQDVQATLLAFTANSIAQCVTNEVTTVYLCGGGAYNKALVNQLQLILPTIQIDTTAALGIAPEWVEAIAFAWLAKQTMAGLSGNVASVTGASRETVLGGIYPHGGEY